MGIFIVYSIILFIAIRRCNKISSRERRRSGPVDVMSEPTPPANIANVIGFAEDDPCPSSGGNEGRGRVGKFLLEGITGRGRPELPFVEVPSTPIDLLCLLLLEPGMPSPVCELTYGWYRSCFMLNLNGPLVRSGILPLFWVGVWAWLSTRI